MSHSVSRKGPTFGFPESSQMSSLTESELANGKVHLDRAALQPFRHYLFLNGG